MKSTDYKVLLFDELSQRRRKNPAYSLGAFARSLGISAPSLSQIMSGKRPLTKKSINKILERCLFAEENRKAFVESALGLEEKEGGEGPIPLQELELESFRVVADWRHYAILSLAELSKNRADEKWIGGQLDISPKSASEAFNRLIKLGLIKKKQRSFYRTVEPFSLPTRTRDKALRQAHHALLEKAQTVLDSDSTRLELFSSITMAVCETKLDTAREMITRFRRELCKHLESGEKKRVYTLAIQLFPLSKEVETKNETHH